MAARCIEHEHDDDPPRCGACARARRRAEQNEYERRIEAHQAELRTVSADKRRAIAECALCDDNGYDGTSRCGHDPHAAERAQRGRQAVYDAMGWNPNGRTSPR